jgi:hypothetical protein
VCVLDGKVLTTLVVAGYSGIVGRFIVVSVSTMVSRGMFNMKN